MPTTPPPQPPEQEPTPKGKNRPLDEHDRAEVKGLLRRLLVYARRFLMDTFGIQEGTDVSGTITTIEKGVRLRGSNVWILIASAMLASVGLDTNSEAVIIGAMLISPLMSPILGIGLSVGITDRMLLYSSVRNFGIATAVSILASALYFFISPLAEPTEQMSSRITPTLLDVGVAIFGGVAGIVATSRSDKTNAIPGVAIATALMPPLCVAGFGMATLDAEYFFGAFYLFFLNASFIALTTFLLVRYLDFPKRAFVSKEVERKVKRYIAIFIFIVIIPAGWIFYNLIQRVRTQRGINEFIAEQMNTNGREVFQHEVVDLDSVQVLKLYMMGEPIPSDSLEFYQNRLKGYASAMDSIKMVQMDVPASERDRLASQIKLEVLRTVELGSEMMTEKQSTIEKLQSELQALRGDSLAFGSIAEETAALFPELRRMQFARMLTTDFRGLPDTVPTVILEWEDKLEDEERVVKQQRLVDFLRARTDFDTLQVMLAPNRRVKIRR